MQFDIAEMECRPPLDRVYPNPQAAFQHLKTIDGEIFRQIANRKTTRFVLANQAYFLKWHEPVGWAEIIKNIVRCRLPVIGAKTEWRALNALQSLGIACPPAIMFGATRSRFFQQQSFIVTREVPDAMELNCFFEDSQSFCRDKKFRARLAVVQKVAGMVKKMHAAGINHRDLYISHFLLENASRIAVAGPEVAVIDLHRAQIRKTVPVRWLIKDLAALYFSVFDLPVSRHHIFRFLKIYFAMELRELLARHQRLLKAVRHRAIKFYIRDNKRPPVLPV